MKRLWHKIDKALGLPVDAKHSCKSGKSSVTMDIALNPKAKVMPKRKKQKARKYARYASFKDSTIPRHSPSEGGNRDKSIKGLSDGNLKHRYNVTDY